MSRGVVRGRARSILLFAILLFAEAARGSPSEAFDRAFYVSVPIGGLSAVGTGLRARSRDGGRVPRGIGLLLGSLELAVSLLALVGLAKALRSVGAG